MNKEPEPDKMLKRHTYVVDRETNGGEQVSITTEFWSNGDEITGPEETPEQGIYTTQEINLMSYCNSASIYLAGARFTPTKLRELADQLEKVEKEVREEYER